MIVDRQCCGALCVPQAKQLKLAPAHVASSLSSLLHPSPCINLRPFLGPRTLGCRLRPKQLPQAYVTVPHQDLYHTTDTPITKFGLPPFPSDFYIISDRIGAGTFGQVYLATHKQTGDKFAVKKMPKRRGTGGTLERYYVRRIRNEIDIHDHLGRSLNIAYLYGAYEDDKDVFLLMEMCTGGELWDKIKLGSYSESDAGRLVTEILRTVAQCHAAGVLLRDVKPENFLFASKEPGAPLKAIDFGISVFCDPGQWVDVRAGTPIYIAPEVLKQRYTLSADMWSVGVVAYQLLTGRLPFAGEEGSHVAEAFMSGHKCDNKDVFRAVLYSELDFDSAPWDVLSPSAKDFVMSLLDRDEAKRPTAEQALHHKWLEECHAVDDFTPIPIADTIVQRLQRYGTYGRLRQAALRKLAHTVSELTENGKEGSSALPAALRMLSETLPSIKSRGKTLETNNNNDGSDNNNNAAVVRVSVKELREVLEGGHFNLAPVEADQLLAQVTADENGTIDYEQWVAAMVDWDTIRTSTDWDSVVEEAFNQIDRDHRGVITAADLEMLLCGEEGCEAPDVVEAALREADQDHDGSISLEEFKELVSEKHESRLELFDPRLRSGEGA